MVRWFSLSARQVFLALLLAGLLLPASAQTGQETRIYQVSNRTAQGLARQVLELYQQAPVTVTARGSQLVARGEPWLLDEIGLLIDSLDVPAVQMRISVRYQQSGTGTRAGASVERNHRRTAASVNQSSSTRRITSERHLVVQDGQSAHITSGNVRTLPFAIQSGRHPATILEQVETRSGFVVSPQAISDRAVELNIVSFEQDPAALPGYQTEALITQRRVQPGQWVSLGGVSSSQEHQQGGLVYRQDNHSTGQLAIEVKVEVLP